MAGEGRSSLAPAHAVEGAGAVAFGGRVVAAKPEEDEFVARAFPDFGGDRETHPETVAIAGNGGIGQETGIDHGAVTVFAGGCISDRVTGRDLQLDVFGLIDGEDEDVLSYAEVGAPPMTIVSYTCILR